MQARSALLRLVAPAAGVAVAYTLAAELSLQLSLVEENVTPLWPPSGIAVVGLLLFGRRVVPGVAAAAFLVNLPISETVWAAGLTAVGNTVGPLVAALALKRVGFRPELDRTRDAVAIVAAALGAMLISASVGTGTLVAAGTIQADSFLGAAAVWWAGDAMGVLVVAPFLLSLRLWAPVREASAARIAEGVLTAAAVVTVTALVLRSGLALLFLVVPLVGWVAWRFRQLGAAPAALVVASIASWSASRGIGVFADGGLLEKMLQLQAFNATVALTSFFFAAVVTERVRARERLEASAAQLEVRVRERTEELAQRERQLAEAQQLANVGSWEWLVGEDRVTWSDQMYRIHGHEPHAFPLTMVTATEQVLEEDVELIRASVAGAFARGEDHDLPVVEYRIARPDGAQRSLTARGRMEFGPDGEPLRMVGTVQDVTESRRAEREHRVAETLQRSLLPDRLPEIPGVELAARYVPATADLEVGGDWYDVVQLPNGFVGAAIGDVAGHGLHAASTMGQLRMALRAYALSEDSPLDVVRRTHRLLHRVAPWEMATLLYVVLDPDTGTIRWANAGHPPPLVVGPDGSAEFLREGLGPPMGAILHPAALTEAEARLEPGSALLLYTDGLVERRGESLTAGLERLRALAANGDADPARLAGEVLAGLVGDEVDDDVAVLVVRSSALGPGPVRMRIPADPSVLAPLRHTMRRWLRESDASTEEAHDILLAVGEACANAIQHAYGARQGTLRVELSREGRDLTVTVRDRGTWREPSGAEGGHGLSLMEHLMDGVDVQRGERGTEVRLRRRLRARAGV